MYQSFKNRLRQVQGFTLIEVLVVVIILGILAGIVTVAVSRARERAIEGACLSAASSLKEATDLYVVDNGGLYPPVASDGSRPSSTALTALTASTSFEYDDAAKRAALLSGGTNAAGLYPNYVASLPTYVTDSAVKDYYLQVGIVWVSGTTDPRKYNVRVTGYKTKDGGNPNAAQTADTNRVPKCQVP